MQGYPPQYQAQGFAPQPVAGFTPQPWTPDGLVGDCWKRVKAQQSAFMMLVVANLIVGIFVGPLVYVPALLPFFAQFTGIYPGSVEAHSITLACTAINLVVSTFFNPGMARLYVAFLRGQRTSVGLLFSGVRGWGRILALQTVFVIPTVLGLLTNIAGAALHLSILTALGGLVTMGGGLLTFVATLFIFYTSWLVADRDMPLVDAIKTSLELTRGFRLQIFVTLLLSGLVMLAGIFACGVGMIVTAPLGVAITALLYLRATGQDPFYGQPPSQLPYGAAPNQGQVPAALQAPYQGAPPPPGGFGGGYGPGPGGYGQGG